MRSKLPFFFFALFLPFLGEAQIAVYDLHVHVEQVLEEGMINLNENEHPLPADTHSDQRFEVHFNSNAFGETDSTGTYWFDFHDKNTFHVDLEGNFTSLSELYHVADYRIAEAANRAFLNKMLQSATPNANLLSSQLNEEILFRHVLNDSAAVKNFTLEERGDTLVWSVADQELTRFVPGKKRKKGVDVDPELLYKYLLYRHEIHPFIAKQIAATKRCPDFLEYQYQNMGQKVTKELKLNVKHASRLTTLPNVKSLTFKQRNGVTKWDRKLNQLNADLLANRIQRVDSATTVATFNKLKEKEENLSALLVVFNLMFSTGTQLTEQISEVVPLAAEDEQLAQFLATLASPNSKEEAEAHLAVFNQLINQVDEYAFVLNVFAANQIQVADPNRALNYFELALAENRTIAGVYLDLGNVFCSQYNFNLGWKCYYAAKMLAPDHPMGVEVVRKRKNLEQILPAYF